ncbi:hypothetical protein ACL02S_15060 [Nocardia sp. 004]|uniref:hypothetical protein n=1 Tax=Nocardia sp. 004 TaxID=3385978 RepID=UPI0039A01AB7
MNRTTRGNDALATPLVATPPHQIPEVVRYQMLRRRVIRLLRLLSVEPSDGVGGIIDAVASALDLSIIIYPTNLMADAMLGFTDYTDTLGYVIFVQSATTPEHQAHIVLHEVAHIMLETFEPLDDLPALGNAHRTADYSTPGERDAEFVARAIGTLLDLDSDARLPTQPDPRVERLAQTLQDRIGW